MDGFGTFVQLVKSSEDYSKLVADELNKLHENNTETDTLTSIDKCDAEIRTLEKQVLQY